MSKCTCSPTLRFCGSDASVNARLVYRRHRTAVVEQQLSHSPPFSLFCIQRLPFSPMPRLDTAEILCKPLVLLTKPVRSGFCSLECAGDVIANYRLQTHHDFGWVFRLLLKPKTRFGSIHTATASTDAHAESSQGRQVGTIESREPNSTTISVSSGVGGSHRAILECCHEPPQGSHRCLFTN